MRAGLWVRWLIGRPIGDPVIESSRPDIARVVRTWKHRNCSVFMIDIDAPKRPETIVGREYEYSPDGRRASDTTTHELNLVPSEGTPEGQQGDWVRLVWHDVPSNVFRLDYQMAVEACRYTVTVTFTNVGTRLGERLYEKTYGVLHHRRKQGAEA